MGNKSSASKKRQPSGLLSSTEKPKNPQAGEPGRRGTVTGRKAGAQKLSVNQKRGIAKRADRARWS